MTTVCSQCLAGEEGECHTPGCAFWMCDAPTAEQAERMRMEIPVQATRCVVCGGTAVYSGCCAQEPDARWLHTNDDDWMHYPHSVVPEGETAQ